MLYNSGYLSFLMVPQAVEELAGSACVFGVGGCRTVGQDRYMTNNFGKVTVEKLEVTFCYWFFFYFRKIQCFQCFL